MPKGVKNKTAPAEKLLFEYLQAGGRAGCPEDQIVNFFKSSYFLQPKQIEMSAAARSCDHRCAACNALYEIGRPIKKDCEDCGPRMIGVGGARGGGKSAWMIAQVALDDCLRFPGLSFLYVRKSAKTLRAQMRKLLQKTCLPGSYNYREQVGEVIFPNGSMITIRHFKDESEIDNFLGEEYDGIGYEELTTLSADKFTNLNSCLRTSKNGWRPRVYASWNWGGIGHCVPHGEVLTIYGWRRIQDVRVGDMVWSVDEKGKAQIRPVEQIHKSIYAGEMISVSANGLKMEFTKNHKVARLKTITTKNDGSFDLKTFDELPGKTGILRQVNFGGGKEINQFSLKDISLRGESRQPLSVSGNDYFSFMGWYLSEGHALTKGKEYEYRVSIAQTKSEQRRKIDALMSRMGISGSWNSVEFSFYDRTWNYYLNEFGLCREKYVPQIIKDSTMQQIWIFLESYIDGDGHWIKRGKSGQIYTISKRMADDLCELCVKCGFIVHQKERKRENRRGLSYEVYFKKTKSLGTEILTGNHKYKVATHTKRKTEISRKHVENVPVYCIGVKDFHNFIIRQNGSVWVSGNSWVKNLFYDPWKEKREITTRYILALAQDNKHNNPEYLNDLQNFVGWKYQSWFLGNPDFSAGNFFAAFREDVHVYPNENVFIEDRSICRWFGSMDYGSSMPNCFHLHGEDDNGTCYTMGELHTMGNTISENAEEYKDMLRLHNLNPEDLEFIATGHDCLRTDRETTKDGSTVLTEFEENGLTLEAVYINRVNAFSQMQERLGNTERGFMPTWFIHRSCSNLIEQVKNAQCDLKKENDIIKQNADRETGEGGSDALESARNGIVMAYNSVLTNAKPLQMGNHKSLIDPFDENKSIEEQLQEAEEMDMQLP